MTNPADRMQIGFGRRIAVLVIDITRGNVEDRWTADPHVRVILEPIARLLAAARRKNMPVFYTRGGLFSQTAHAAPITRVERGSWTWKIPLNDERGMTSDELAESMEIPAQIAPAPGEVVINKIKPSGFFESPLHSLLTWHGIDTVIVCGTATNSGVLHTVADAFSYNYRPIVPRECCGTRTPEFHEVSLDMMDRIHADVMDVNDVLREIDSRPAQEPAQRPVQQSGPTPLRAGFGERPAVLVIDMHRGSVEDRWTPHAGVKAAVEPIARLLAVARPKGVPVIYTSGGLFNLTAKAAPFTPAERGSWVWKNPLHDSWGSTPEEIAEALEIPAAIAPQPGEPVITKYRPSGFYESPLRSFLTFYSVDTVIVCGAATNSGVLHTVNDAFSANYRVIVPRECVGTRTPEFHEVSLAMIDQSRGDVLALEDVIAHLEQMSPMEVER
jgi:nicotinamidase-related amidase